MRRGLSLLELVVVLLLLGIAASVAAPALARLAAPDPVRDGAERVRTVLRRARLTAVQRGRTVVVVVVPEQRRYRAWLVGDDARPLADGVIELPADFRLQATSPRPTFTFSPRGRASGEAIVVRGAGRAASVVVDPWTGDPRVLEP
ncbi:MAG TPA: GspH/FimT family protein [Longimicrobiales bacterium]